MLVSINDSNYSQLSVNTPIFHNKWQENIPKFVKTHMHSGFYQVFMNNSKLKYQ